jgi:hypothetical protein
MFLEGISVSASGIAGSRPADVPLRSLCVCVCTAVNSSAWLTVPAGSWKYCQEMFVTIQLSVYRQYFIVA